MNKDFFDDDNNDVPEEGKNQIDSWTPPPVGWQHPYGFTYNKKPKKATAIIIFFFLAVFILGIIITLNDRLGKGWISNLFQSDDRVQIVIPLQDKPKLDSDYYDEATGKYTAQGIGKTVMPSVVSILIYSSDSFLTPTSQGSGIILTENGYIITNAHVIDGATRSIKVILFDDKEYQAKVVGSDSRTDLAVIKINTTGLTPAVMGNSDQLEIGEEIVALGSPAGLYGSLTKGVVSGLDRMIRTEIYNLEMNCIQIDAAINPGNSGGALVNMYGQVVGINSSKFIAEEYDGIGFAISINAAKPILEELIADGYIKDRVRVGIVFYEISEESAQIYNMKAGLLISSVDEACDIANSGLMIDDTITEINGIVVRNADDVDVALKGYKPGDTVTATVFRTDEDGTETYFEISFKLMSDSTYNIPGSDN